MPNIKDLDFLGFTFNGYHSYYDLGIIRTSQGARYNEQLTPETTEITQEIPGGDGQYYFNSYDKSRTFDVQIAYDGLKEDKLRMLRNVFNGKVVGDLIFDEKPYKVYSVKVTGTPTLKYIPFNDIDGQRVYKGEGTIQFTAYWPYAHTPNVNTSVSTAIKSGGKFGGDGRDLSQYSESLYPTKAQWQTASGLKNVDEDFVVGTGENYGDVPAPFIFRTTEDINPNFRIKVGDTEVTILSACSGLEWNSKTGLIHTNVKNNQGAITGKTLVKYRGHTTARIPVGENTEVCIVAIVGDDQIEEKWPLGGQKNMTLEYDYWYY